MNIRGIVATIIIIPHSHIFSKTRNVKDKLEYLDAASDKHEYLLVVPVHINCQNLYCYSSNYCVVL